jgi:GntR family transcriptional regulator of vanillate catabolism
MESTQSRVLVQLRDLILKGGFVPGERLAEIPIAERLGASRTPVKLALATLEHEGLIESSPGGGYQMRKFTSREVSDAILVRGLLEGYAARTIAEHGLSRQFAREFQECLDVGDKAVDKESMDLDDYAAYVEMNNRFHELLVAGSGNTALARAIDMLNGLPFAAASAMLPMQSSIDEGHESMRLAHRQHHALVHAMERGQGFRAQALCEEHVEIARMNLEFALDRPDVVAGVLPGIALVDGSGRSGRFRRPAEAAGQDRPAGTSAIKGVPSP